MKVFAVLTHLACSLIAGTAAVALPQANSDVADFHYYGSDHCDLDLGTQTVQDGGTNSCGHFTSELQVVPKSIRLDSVKDGCHLYVFTDFECTSNKVEAVVGQCLATQNEFLSWIVQC
ncbi:hypothetical protein K461DRAFT_282529 [Myriangium duriaei CBS 260.36]|uniref:Uncharacterized protein n=1 Tax=Myriangium duriaei CBS 260.36 TaxID=1168546 RepID=A0A9P4MDN3_9PEZI|nr:hypothetical protein K461DRAFT_282529 [Myriangium duriaei CBS 260.36]